MEGQGFKIFIALRMLFLPSPPPRKGTLPNHIKQTEQAPIASMVSLYISTWGRFKLQVDTLA